MRLTPNFRLDEFRCRHCGDVNAANAHILAQQLQQVRDIYGPMRIVSGFRCKVQNELEHGAFYSQHLVGLAADIACDNDQDRYRLLKLLIDFHFPRLGIGAHIIHADIGTITGPIIWVY
jgi:uncharacterized protein YcbK (DUF882 family)